MHTVVVTIRKPEKLVYSLRATYGLVMLFYASYKNIIKLITSYAQAIQNKEPEYGEVYENPWSLKEIYVLSPI